LLNVTGYFPAPGLCMFFVLSGALLLPVKGDAFAFLKKRIGKIVFPTLVFTFVYLLFEYSEGKDIDWIKKLCSIPFSNQGNGILWFMYTLTGLYLLAPILSKWLACASRREVELYLGLWTVTLCYPMFSMLAEINTADTGMLFYFQGYVGYFLLGYYLRKYPDALSLKVMTVPALIAIVAPVACKIGHIEVNFYSVFWYLSIFVAILTVAMYKVFTVKKLILTKGSQLEQFVTTTSSLTFGIYLVHIVVMRHWLWKQDWIIGIGNYYLQWAVIVVLTFIISWLICWLISLMPIGAYIIGYCNRRDNYST